LPLTLEPLPSLDKWSAVPLRWWSAEVEHHARWRSAEVERRSAGWSAAPLGGGCAAAGWMEQERLSTSVLILGVLVICRPGGEVEDDPVVEVEADPVVRR
jgi:hypothetical protein